jgi:hypothetical protein
MEVNPLKYESEELHLYQLTCALRAHDWKSTEQL